MENTTPTSHVDANEKESTKEICQNEKVRYSCVEVLVSLLKSLVFKICCLSLCHAKHREGDPDYAKNMLFRKGKNKLFYYMDIITYFKKMQEFDIIKYILLNDDQLKLLNFVSKPLISENKRDIYELINEKYDNNNIILDKIVIDELNSSYNKLSQSKNRMDEKLINLFNYEIDSIIE